MAKIVSLSGQDITDVMNGPDFFALAHKSIDDMKQQGDTPVMAALVCKFIDGSITVNMMPYNLDKIHMAHVLRKSAILVADSADLEEAEGYEQEDE
jgi:hypothetical protein